MEPARWFKAHELRLMGGDGELQREERLGAALAERMGDRCATAINRYLRYGRLPVPLLDSNRVFSLMFSGQKPGTARAKRGKNSLRVDRETCDAVSTK